MSEPKKRRYTVKPKRATWYEMHYQDCPVCGKDHSYKVARYDAKPEDITLRIFYKEYYDYCEDSYFYRL